MSESSIHQHTLLATRQRIAKHTRHMFNRYILRPVLSAIDGPIGKVYDVDLPIRSRYVCMTSLRRVSRLEWILEVHV